MGIYIVYICCSTDVTSKGTPTKAFEMMRKKKEGEQEEDGCFAARTLHSVFAYIYNGHSTDQVHFKPARLAQLMACADYLQIDSLTAACKNVLDERCARNNVRFCFH